MRLLCRLALLMPRREQQCQFRNAGNFGDVNACKQRGAASLPLTVPGGV